jgi:hypothetical protein
MSRIRSHLVRIVRYTTETPKYNIQDFKRNYPISMDSKYRTHSFTKHLRELQPLGRFLLIMPLRNWMADIISSEWINQRFKSNDSSSYLQTEFVTGAQSAIRRFFDLLQKDIVCDDDGDTSEITLKDILTENLSAEFQHHHQQFAMNGLQLTVRLNSVTNFNRVCNWMTFGPRGRVTTTLQKGQIYTEFTPYAFWRFNPEKRKWLYSEGVFEYDVSPNDIDLTEEVLELPSLRTRSELNKMGAVVGIEVTADIDATIIVNDKHDPANQWIETIRREMNFRFESTHCSEMNQGSWKIADIDNFYASKLFDE